MAATLLAGVLNLSDLPASASSLAAWDLLPKGVRVPVLLGVPTMEVGIALAWFLWIGRPVRRLLWPAALAILALAAAVPGARLISAEPPDCECVGLIAAFRATQRDAETALTRNAMLMGALLAGAALVAIGRPEGGAPSSGATPRAATAKPGTPAGFTLIESIMVMAIVGLLLALTVPQLAMVREAAQRTISRSNLRNHVQVFTMHTGDHDGEFPFFMRPDAPQTIIRGGGRAQPVPLEHYFFASAAYWPIALAPYYADVAFHESVFPPGPQAGITYYYSNNFVASPDFWRRETRLAGTSQYRPIGQHQVRHPANKGLMLDTVSYGYYEDPVYWPPRADGSVLVGVVDGSARSVDRDSLAPTYPPAPAERLAWPIVHTVGGVDAADVP